MDEPVRPSCPRLAVGRFGQTRRHQPVEGSIHQGPPHRDDATEVGARPERLGQGESVRWASCEQAKHGIFGK
jgi:hypothetical protein